MALCYLGKPVWARFLNDDATWQFVMDNSLLREHEELSYAL
jgi:hypothetical protein